METRGRAGKMQRGNELALRGGYILRFMPALNVGQDELDASDGLCDGQVAGMADAAAIAMGRPIVMVDLFGDCRGGLKAGKEGQQEQYKGGPHKLPALKTTPHHGLSLELRECFRKLVVVRSAELRGSSGRSRWFGQRCTRSTA
jgi:hypothetical protein